MVKVPICIEMLFIFSMPMLVRHQWQLKTVDFLHWCLICAILLINVIHQRIYVYVCVCALYVQIYGFRVNILFINVFSEFVFDGAGNAYYRCFYITMKTAISVGMNVKPVSSFLSHP